MPIVPIKSRSGQVVASALIDSEYFDWLDQWEWRLHRCKSGLYYAQRSVFYEGRSHYLAMHREIMHLSGIKRLEVDHVNGNGLDNRTSNLRVVTHAQNQQNKGPLAGTTSRHRGVFWRKDKRKWVAQGKVSGQSHHLGYFKDEEEAARVASAWYLENVPFAVETRLAS